MSEVSQRDCGISVTIFDSCYVNITQIDIIILMSSTKMNCDMTRLRFKEQKKGKKEKKKMNSISYLFTKKNIFLNGKTSKKRQERERVRANQKLNNFFGGKYGEGENGKRR